MNKREEPYQITNRLRFKLTFVNDNMFNAAKDYDHVPDLSGADEHNFTIVCYGSKIGQHYPHVEFGDEKRITI